MYTRVFESILDSSLNVQSVPVEARWLWIAMLLIADKACGIVDMPLERLAARAGLTPGQTLDGIDILAAPDPDSRSQLEEGRRIVALGEGIRGWRLVNWDEYRAITKAYQQREQTRIRVARHRERKGSGNGDVTHANDLVTKHTEYEFKAEAESEVEGFSARNAFESLWVVILDIKIPAPVGKEAAWGHYHASVLTATDAADCVFAHAIYAKSDRVKRGFVQNASTFFNNWRDWLNYEERGSAVSRERNGREVTESQFFAMVNKVNEWQRETRDLHVGESDDSYWQRFERKFAMSREKYQALEVKYR